MPLGGTITFMQTCYATGRGALMALIDSVATITDCDFYTSGTTFTHGDGGGIRAQLGTGPRFR